MMVPGDTATIIAPPNWLSRAQKARRGESGTVVAVGVKTVGIRYGDGAVVHVNQRFVEGGKK